MSTRAVHFRRGGGPVCGWLRRAADVGSFVRFNRTERFIRFVRKELGRRSRPWGLPVYLVGLVLLWASPVASQAAEVSAFLLRVRLPIEGSVDEDVRRAARRLVAQSVVQGDRPILVLEFWPTLNVESVDPMASEFERSLALARFLSGSELASLRTVAYLPKSVKGHAVLPVLACEEIIAAPDIEFGAAGIQEGRPSVMMRGFYADIADRTRTIPSSVALGMIDRRLKVVRATTTDGVQYVAADELEELQRRATVTEVATVADVGDFVTFSGTDLRLEHGFASRLVQDRRELANELGIDPAALEPNPALGGEWHAVQLPLEGPLNFLAVDRVMRAVESQRRDGRANLVVLRLNSPGGDPENAVLLANYLAGLDSSRLRTVAYVNDQALGDAALVACACDQIVVEEGAVLGGAGAHEPSEQQREDLKVAVQRICQEKSRHWSLPLALVDHQWEVYRYTNTQTGRVDSFSEEELAELPDPDRWRQGESITVAGETLQLLASDAVSLGFAKVVVDDFAEFRRVYDLDAEPVVVEPGWADDLIAFLARPSVAGTLLFFAGFALMVELSSPGVGGGAFVSAVCFVLFFWSQFLNGTANWLEILLFVTGLIFIALEIFVIPGFGIFGLGGGALVVAALVLASQTFVVPQNDYQVQQFPRSLVTVAGAGAGVFFGLYALRTFLDRTPLLNRVVLPIPDEEELQERERRESPLDYDRLVGHAGLAMTRLMPAGKARIDGQILAVISRGEPIDAGVGIVVEEVMGNRVIVRSSDETPTPT